MKKVAPLMMGGLLLALLCCASPAMARHTEPYLYRNDYYHLSVTVPRRTKLCGGGGHGFTVALERQACTRAAVNAAPHIHVYTGFAADLDDVETSEELAAARCSREDDPPAYTREPAPDDLVVPGYPTILCKRTLPDGMVEFEIVAFVKWPNTKHWDLEKNWSSEFEVILQTTPARLDQDMRLVKRLLHSTRFKFP